MESFKQKKKKDESNLLEDGFHYVLDFVRSNNADKYQ